MLQSKGRHSSHAAAVSTENCPSIDGNYPSPEALSPAGPFGGGHGADTSMVQGIISSLPTTVHDEAFFLAWPGPRRQRPNLVFRSPAGGSRLISKEQRVGPYKLAGDLHRPGLHMQNLRRAGAPSECVLSPSDCCCSQPPSRHIGARTSLSGARLSA